MSLAFSDWLIIGIYMLITLGIGLAFTRKSGKSLEAYILGGRNLPWWVAGLSMVATTFAADTPLAVTELVAKNGISGNWMWWNMLMGGMLTVFFFAILWRKAGVLTEPELITLRYGGKPARYLRVFRSIYLGLFMNILIIGWVNIAFMSLLEVFFGLNAQEQLICTGGIMLLTAIYTSLSGLLGVAYTDVFQFVIAMTGCIVLAVIVISSPEIGGLSGLKAQLPAETLSFFPEISGVSDMGMRLSLSLGTFCVFASLQWWASWYPGAEPGGGGYVAQRMMGTKSGKDALLSVLLFQIAHYCIRPWPWILVALACIILYPDLPPESARMGYIMAMRDFLPEGMKGLILAAFLGAYMSTLSTQLNWGAGYLVHDIPASIKGSDSKEGGKSRVLAGRIIVIALMLLSLFATTFMNSITGVWEFILQCGAGLGLVLILRWFWWRINVWSEITASIAPFVFMGIAYIADFKEFAVSYIFTLSGTTISWLLVTFLTPAESSETLQAFYTRIRPAGMWSPIRKITGLNREGSGLGLQLLCWISAVLFTYSVLFSVGNFLLGFPERLKYGLITGAISCFILLWKMPGLFNSSKKGTDQG